MTKHVTRLASLTFFTLLSVVPRAAAQTPVQSFAALQPAVKVGQRVVVTDDKGTVIKGRIASIAGDTLEITPAWKLFGTRGPSVFKEDSILRIEDGDGNWNGALIGAAVGVLGSWLVGANWTGDEGGFGVIATILILSPAAGVQIDDAIRRPLYISPRMVKTSVMPIAGKGRLGISVGVRF